MDITRVLKTLEQKGKPNTVKIYGRHGVTGPCYGVSYADLGALVRQIGTDTDLAVALWKTGNHDARVLATKVADPETISERTVRAWIRDVDNYVLADAVSGVAARMPAAGELARDWIDADGEWVGAAGWNILSVLAMDGKLPEAEARALIARVSRNIRLAPNRTRHAMNNTLITIGGRIAALTDRALAAARDIGPVEVDHGQTGCKTPDAADMIGRMRARATPARTRVTGARMGKKEGGRAK